MEEMLASWARGLQEAFGDKLSSVILYGSAARGEYQRSRSDLNLILVFKELDLEDITRVRKMTPSGLRRKGVQPVFWTEAELANAWDVFPLEFMDIAENHRCLVGTDPFAGREVDKGEVRYQLEFELRSKLIALRDAWANIDRDRYALEQFLIKAGNSFAYLCRRAESLLGIRIEDPLDVFGRIRRLKKKELRLNRAQLQGLFSQLHDTVRSAIRSIDAAKRH